MKRYVETVCRYWLLVLVPILALPVVEGLQLRHTPKSFYASTNIFAEQSVLTTVSPANSYMTPAQVEQANISQWLQSPTFCLAVARGSAVYAQLLALSPDPLGQAGADLPKNIQVTTLGNNLLSIGYTAANPVQATQVLSSLLRTAALSTQASNARQASVSLSYYRFQLHTAQVREQTSAGALATYLQQHALTQSDLAGALATDPTLSTLFAQNKADHQAVTDLRDKIQTTITQNSIPSTIVDQSGYYIADPPSYYAVSTKKKQLEYLGIALALGLLLGASIVVVLTALDRTIRLASDVPALLGVPVLAIVPYNAAFARRHRASARAGAPARGTPPAKGGRAS